MPSFEEEAFARAQRMHRRLPHHRDSAQNPEQLRTAENEQKTEQSSPPPKAEMPKNTNHNEHRPNDGLLDIMFKNKDQSLILLLIILLMEEDTEPSLLLALMYLLI